MIRFPHSKPVLITSTLLAAALLCATLAHAAPPPPADDEEAPVSVSHPVVEPTAPSAGKALNAALGRLAKDPRNADALLEAGNAAIALGDNEAALGFFTRADQVAPSNPTVKTAIAGARLHLDDPVEALRWYAEAEKAGADPVTFALDRGLAYDLVGDNAAAVAQYRKVLAHSSDEAMRDEAVRRQAISLAIGGDRRGADRVLLPLLQRQDRAAWRAHIFVLAIAGRSDDAVSVMHATMPADLAAAIGPYLRFMGQLTPAQQAAAASLGRFPRAADIGRDDPRVAVYAAAHPRVPLAPAETPTQSAAATDSSTHFLQSRHRKGRDQTGTVAVAAPAKPAVEPDIALPPPPPPPTAQPTGLAAATPPGAPVASRSTTTPPRTGFDLAQVTGTTADNGSPTAAVVPRPTVLSRLDMPPAPRRTSPAHVSPVPAPAPVAPIPAVPIPAGPIPAGPIPAGPVTTTPVTPQSPPVQSFAATPVVQPTPVPVAAPAPTVTFPPVAGSPVPPVADVPASQPVAASHAVVQTLPDKPATPKTDLAKADAAKAETGKGRHARTAPDKVAQTDVPAEKDDKSAKVGKSGHDKPAKGKDAKAKDAKAKTGKDKSDATADEDTSGAKDKSAKAKALHGKAAKDQEADAALVPCKPVATGKGRKARAAAAKQEHSRTANAKSRHHGKAKQDDADSDTCAANARGDRPDGPAGVSRDADSNDDSHATKGKAKGKEKSSDRDSDKKSEKGGKKARYASRIWVEVLTGADRDKLPTEWRGLVHKAHKLKGRKPYVTPWRSNFRLLTGPFDSDADAQDFIAELRKDGVSGFEWTSPAGQAVDSLALP